MCLPRMEPWCWMSNGSQMNMERRIMIISIDRLSVHFLLFAVFCQYTVIIEDTSGLNSKHLQVHTYKLTHLYYVGSITRTLYYFFIIWKLAFCPDSYLFIFCDILVWVVLFFICLSYLLLFYDHDLVLVLWGKLLEESAIICAQCLIKW